MVPRISTILQRLTGEWAALLQPEAILAVCGVDSCGLNTPTRAIFHGGGVSAASDTARRPRARVTRNPMVRRVMGTSDRHGQVAGILRATCQGRKPNVADLIGVIGTCGEPRVCTRARAWARTGMSLALLQRRAVTHSLITLDPRGQETLPMARSRHLTLLAVIQAVSDIATNEQETLATVVHLIHSGQVRLCDEVVRAMRDLLARTGVAA
jgi:hypothetical protein